MYEEMKDTNIIFYYIYDVEFQECFSSNIFVLGMTQNQKITALSYYFLNINIERVVLIYEKEIGYYTNDIYQHIFSLIYNDVESYEITDIRNFRRISDEISLKNKKTAIILSIEIDSYNVVYTDLFRLTQLYKDKYFIFNIRFDIYDSHQMNHTIIKNTHIIANILPSYNLQFNNELVNDDIFPMYHQLTLSSFYECYAISTDFHYILKHLKQPLENYSYYAPEGYLTINKSNYVSRVIRIGKFIEKNDDFTVELTYSSSSPILPDPYFYNNSVLLQNITCNVYEDTATETKIILLLDEDLNELITGYLTGLKYFDGIINGYKIIFKKVSWKDTSILKSLLQYENTVGVFGCSSITCVSTVLPIIEENDKTLFTFNSLGICSKNIIVTSTSTPQLIITIINYYYSNYYTEFIILLDSISFVYYEVFCNYCKALNINYKIFIKPDIYIIRNYIEELKGKKIITINTISDLDSTIYNYLSSNTNNHSLFEMNIDNYIYDSRYYTIGVYSISSFFSKIAKEISFPLHKFYQNYFDLYNNEPNCRSYNGFLQVLLFYSIVKKHNTFDFQNILEEIISTKYYIDDEEYTISNTLNVRNNLYLIVVNDLLEYDIIHVYDGVIETVNDPFNVFINNYQGLTCNIDINLNIRYTSQCKVNHFGVLLDLSEINLENYASLALIIINTLDYLSLTGIIYIFRIILFFFRDL